MTARILTPAELSERVADMHAWALSRIEWCRREEAKFSASRDGRLSRSNIPVEAATERRSLQAVLGQLGLAVPAAHSIRQRTERPSKAEAETEYPPCRQCGRR